MKTTPGPVSADVSASFSPSPREPRAGAPCSRPLCGIDPGSPRVGSGRRRPRSGRHGVSDPHDRALSASRPARTATSGSPKQRQQDRPDHPGRRRHRVPDSHGRQRALEHIAAGPDGNLWFTESGGNQIGRITPAGVVTEFSDPHGRQRPCRHRGRPGRQPLVHRSIGANKIGRITTAGVVTEFAVPTTGSRPDGIAAGPDGNLWFTESLRRQPDRPDHPGRRRHRVPRPARPSAVRAASRPARTATSGSPKSPATRSGGSPRPASSPSSRSPRRAASSDGIAAGPDGNLWFTEVDRQQDRPDHHRPASITEFPDPDRRQPASSGSRPARTATSGSPSQARQPDRPDHHRPASITEFPIPTAGS